jgi:hypothetical protein
LAAIVAYDTGATFLCGVSEHAPILARARVLRRQ